MKDIGGPHGPIGWQGGNRDGWWTRHRPWDLPSFRAEGATVVVAEIDEKDGGQVAHPTSPASAEPGQFLRTDVMDRFNVEATVATTVEQLGRADILVNDAILAQAPHTALEEKTDSDVPVRTSGQPLGHVLGHAGGVPAHARIRAAGESSTFTRPMVTTGSGTTRNATRQRLASAVSPCRVQSGVGAIQDPV